MIYRESEPVLQWWEAIDALENRRTIFSGAENKLPLNFNTIIIQTEKFDSILEISIEKISKVTYTDIKEHIQYQLDKNLNFIQKSYELYKFLYETGIEYNFKYICYITDIIMDANVQNIKIKLEFKTDYSIDQKDLVLVELLRGKTNV